MTDLRGPCRMCGKQNGTVFEHGFRLRSVPADPGTPTIPAKKFLWWEVFPEIPGRPPAPERLDRFCWHCGALQ